jgi:DNA-binding transcriptional LysR family regulator
LELLHVVASSGSITEAARQLDYSPSAVSQQIAALEREAGMQVLVRLPRGVRLTDAGAALARHGEAIVRHSREAADELDALRELAAGRVRIAAFPSAGAALVPRLVSSFKSEHPEIAVSLELMEPAGSVEALREGLIDLALVFAYPFEPAPDLDGLTVVADFDDEVLLAVAADHELAGGGPLRAERLGGAAWIGNTERGCALMLRHVAARGGFEPTVSFESDDYLTIGRLVESRLGVALVPRLAAGEMPASVSLRPLRPAFVRRVSLLHGQDVTPAVRAMVDVAGAVVTSDER